MNGAELDTRRRALGLSIGETATVLGAGERTISYWISGGGEPRDPEGVSQRLLDVEVAMDDLVDWISDTLSGNRVTLPRYRTQAALDASHEGRGLPLGAHAMAIAWAIDDLRSDGVEVDVIWVDGVPT